MTTEKIPSEGNPHSTLEVSEKNNILASSDVESSGVSSPAEYDDLPDPDAGKSDEERAKLVRQSFSFSFVSHLFPC